MRVIGREWWIAAAILLVSRGAGAQKKPPQPEGVKLLAKVTPDQGFVDDVFAFDGPAGRLALVRADAAAYAELEVLDLAQGGKSLARFDLARITTSPVRIAFVLDGSKLLVTGRGAAGDKVTAFLVDLGGKVLRKWGPATDVVTARLGAEYGDAVTVFNTRSTGKGITYEVAAYRLDGGKAIGKKRTLAADPEGFVKAIDMTILYWQEGYTRLVGRKKGAYDKLKDQRMNDSEAVYDLLDGSVARNTPIGDIIAWTKLVKLRTERSNQPSFLIVTEDLKWVEWVTAEDKRVPLELAEPFHRYDPRSLVQEPGPDGRLYFSLTIDPVNAEAVARKVADAEIVDLYVVDPAAAKARRLARLPRADRPFAWREASGRWAVLRKHKGFDRGGTDLEIYELLTP